ncbi:phage tail protein I [Acinetobacter chinensis]|uniref:Phage tail protein I n=1 Tax=Acinetobacter chinensis TaxID=2004650 RepID=A0ABU3WHF7_9GAMM|nr:phage tail protein I [Acinetobacter chinensis]MDV2469830.1 phage tail protein I [Acinetobacter chinensis]
MSNLLPPNATKLERNVEKLGEKISDLPVPFVDLHHIDRCPVSHLPWLAWQHRVEYWNPDWTADEKRNAISESKLFNAQRGTRSSIESLLSTVVSNFNVKAWHEFEPKQKPYTFVVIISPLDMLSIEQLLQVQTAIDATKSVRDNYSISAKVRTEGEFFTAGAISTGTRVYLSTYTDPYFWTLDTYIQTENGTATYTARSSDGFNEYSSFAEISLLNAAIRSLFDTDMQQWQAVKDACGELIEIENYTFNSIYQRVEYIKVVNSGWLYNNHKTPLDACLVILGNDPRTQFIRTAPDENGKNIGYCRSYYNNGNIVSTFDQTRVKTELVYLNYINIAEKIISNTAAAEPISLHAENYLLNVARSINSTDQSRQFVTLADLIPHFEQNKIIIDL